MILKFHVLLAEISLYNLKHFFILLESVFLQQKMAMVVFYLLTYLLIRISPIFLCRLNGRYADGSTCDNI